LKKENISATAEAIKMLATAGAGSVRDTLSFAETVLSFCGTKEITEDDVTVILGTVGTSALAALLGSIEKRDTKSIVKSVEEIFKKGINANMLVKNFLDVIKSAFLARPELAPIFRVFSELEITIKNSTDQKNHFENACLLASAV
jgi:DNA polymerase-3 subunit gamma/tau